MKRVHTIFWAMLVGLVLSGQLQAGVTGKIAGRAVDAQTGDGLPVVNILVVGTTMGAASNAEGYYVILNVPPGTYSLKATMMGYKPVTVTEVGVAADLTTTIDLRLEPTVVPIEKGVIVVERRPIVEKTTTSVTYRESGEIASMPVEDIEGVVAQTAGAVVQAGDLHLRGGREYEEVFMVDGMVLRDPFSGSFDTHVPLTAIKETAIYTGGFGAEYGSAQSGVINIVTKEGGQKQSGTIRYLTSDYSGLPDAVKEIGDANNDSLAKEEGYRPERLHRGEFGLGGPEPLTSYLLPALGLKLPGKGLTYYVSGDILKTDGDLPHEDERQQSYMGKLAYKPTVNTKFAVGGLRSWNDYHWYRNTGGTSAHLWKYTMDDTLFGRPDYRADSYQWNLGWTQLLSARTFYELKVDQYTTGLVSDIKGDTSETGAEAAGDSLEFWVEECEPYSEKYGADDPEHPERAGYYRPGSLYRIRYHEDKQSCLTAQGHLTSQVGVSHELKTGFEYKYYDIKWFEADLASGGNYYMEDHENSPFTGAAYLQDKMEFGGMIVNAGLRYDYFNPNFDNAPEDPSDPVTDPLHGGEVKDPSPVEIKHHLSPRLGVSHPITERDVLHFTYGHYFQFPRFNYLFRNSSYLFYGAFGIIGNPRMDPEKTVSYEIGVEHAFTPDFAVDVTGFYKDISGLTTTQQIFRGPFDWYALYDNGDYGHSRGFELMLKKRPTGDLLSGWLSYTYSISKGRFSSYYASYYYYWASYRQPTEEHYLDWDQRHTLSLNLDYRVPRNRNLFGVKYLNGIGLSVITNYGSGYPYTPSDPDPYVKPINTERLPYTTTTDFKLNKDFDILGVTLSIFGDVYNVFNRKNLLEIKDDYLEWYEQFGEPGGEYDDPSVWGSGRRVRTGVKIEF